MPLNKVRPFPWGMGGGALPAWGVPAPFPTMGTPSPGTGTPGTPVTMPGTGFGGAPGTVTISGQAATVTGWTNTQIIFTVPTQAAYPVTAAIVVTTAGGIVDSGPNFTTITPVSIASLSASSAAAGTSLTITGSGFLASQGAGTVTVNGQAATVTGWGATSITITVPTQSSYPTTAPVIVTNNNGTAATSTNLTTTAPGPVITAIQQASITVTSALAGTDVTIIGTGFGASQGAGSAVIHGVTAAVWSWSATAIVVRLPYQSSYPDASTFVVTDNSAVASTGFSFTTTYQIDAASFAGAGTLARTTALAISPQAGSLAVSAWVWLDSTAGAQFIAGKCDTTNVEWYLWYFNASGGFRFSGFAASATVSVVSGVTVATGAWHHVMVTWSGGNVTLYVDGANVASAAGAGTNFTQRNTCDLTQGRPMTAGAQGLSGLSGRVDGLAVWDNVTGLLVADVYNGGSGVNYGTASAAAKLHAVAWYDNNDTGWEDQVARRDMTSSGTVTLAAGKT